jgi:hypothetical protein
MKGIETLDRHFARRLEQQEKPGSAELAVMWEDKSLRWNVCAGSGNPRISSADTISLPGVVEVKRAEGFLLLLSPVTRSCIALTASELCSLAGAKRSLAS